MRKYRLWLPGGSGGDDGGDWESDPASNRQIKLLKFFGRLPNGRFSKGRASGITGSIFADPKNRRRWEAYKELTGDYGHESAELQPFDAGELERIVAEEPHFRLVSPQPHAPLPPPPAPLPREAPITVSHEPLRKPRPPWPWIAVAAGLVVAASAWFVAGHRTTPPASSTSAPAAAATEPSPSAASTASTAPTLPPRQSLLTATPAPVPPAATPRLSVVTVAESQAAAVRKRPELAVAGSPMNRDYAAALERLKRANDPLLSDPRHPEMIADRVADEIVRRAQSAPRR